MNQTAYNANNQLTTWGTANLFYDTNGNMTSDGTHSYTWDARNRLKQIDLGNTASFTYDPFGRRATKSIVGTNTTFLYDGANTVQEVIGGTNTANSLSGDVDEVFQRTDSAGARSFLADPLGSTIALTDSTGTLQTQYTFEPFGNTTVSGSATTNSFAYTGRELDTSNLYYYRARYYNPQLQRFIGEDPLNLGDGANNYAYVDNDPVLYVDPTGWCHGLICRVLGLDPDNKVQEADQAIFDLTSPIFSDPFRVAQGQPVELVMINQIEQENLLLDLALVANDASQALAKLPSIGTGMGNDLAMELIRLRRALNDRKIDQLLGQAAKNLAGRYSRYSGTSPSGVSPLSDQSTGRRKN